ncbi:response regulator transcription factor [Stenotrophomonas sp. MMGLT7]|uniref:response regulator n=1 Tax=Stenotrophomonas sp. MMGLT7 TaxID=2901227 RepID=UPI001E616501|nr:response regulator transcription factor [Stenotrophomonas sp. MMGLT7]MCD7097906.1 response regulator transcription factor [Stenotrophomonas sp. MMGLT7]
MKMPGTVSARVAVVDDDDSVRCALGDYLSRNGYAVELAADGQALDRLMALQPVDLVVLDLMLPGEDGLSICRRLLQSGTPVLMLSALGSAMDRVVGLETGADDYLAKPFEPRELLARLRAILRREGRTRPSPPRRAIVFDGWRLEPEEQRLFDPDGEPLALTAGEFALLEAFAAHPGRLLSRDRLLDLTRGPVAESFDRAVDLAVSRLRRKLAGRGADGLIETVRGRGYRFHGGRGR